MNGGDSVTRKLGKGGILISKYGPSSCCLQVKHSCRIFWIVDLSLGNPIHKVHPSQSVRNTCTEKSGGQSRTISLVKWSSCCNNIGNHDNSAL